MLDDAPPNAEGPAVLALPPNAPNPDGLPNAEVDAGAPNADVPAGAPNAEPPPNAEAAAGV